MVRRPWGKELCSTFPSQNQAGANHELYSLRCVLKMPPEHEAGNTPIPGPKGCTLLRLWLSYIRGRLYADDKVNDTGVTSSTATLRNEKMLFIRSSFLDVSQTRNDGAPSMICLVGGKCKRGTPPLPEKNIAYANCS